MILLLLACTTAEPPTSGGSALSEPSHTHRAPGVLLLANLVGEELTVEGLVDAEITVDIDEAGDDWPAFRATVLDSSGDALAVRAAPGPAQVQEYLNYYSDLAGADILEVYPVLGDFALALPAPEGAASVAFALRDAEGAWLELGEVGLDELDVEEPGTEAVEGWETLREGGPAETSLDIALLGDGYTEAQMDAWAADAQALADRLLESEPLTTYAHRINIHRVDAVSAESGASYDCIDECRFRDTAFGSIFAVEFVNQLLGTDYGSGAVFQERQWDVARAASVVPWDAAIVVVNTSHSGGMAMHYATVPNASRSWTDVGVHEFGHLLGRLGDEYVNYECIVSEVVGLPLNISESATEPPWLHQVSEDTPLPTPEGEGYAVGAFEGAYNCGDLYRPAQTCKMKSSSQEFCPVCAERLVVELFRGVDVIRSVELVSGGVGGAELVVEAEEPFEASWAVDGAVVGTGSRLALDASLPGETYELTVSHQSPFVLEDGGQLTETRRLTVSTE